MVIYIVFVQHNVLIVIGLLIYAKMCKNVFVIVLSEWSNSSNRPTSILEKQAHSAAVIHQMHIFPFLWSWIKFEHFLFVHISLLRSNCSDMAVTSKTSSSSAINFWDPFFHFQLTENFFFIDTCCERYIFITPLFA